MVIKTNIFSARAECPRDMIELLNKETWFKNLTWKQMHGYGADIVIEFETNVTLEQLRGELSTITDTHVLMETLRQCPLKDNPLTRDQEVWK